MANQNGTVTSYLKDYHGNVISKTTKTGVMFNEMGTTTDYDAFGNRWQGDAPDPFGYCGEYYDNESGLIYLRNRYYDSTSGRFITEDPIKDGLNWYVYANNNPIMFVDSSGLKTVDELIENEYREIWNLEDKISFLDLTVYEDEELSYKYQDCILHSVSKIEELKNYNLEDEMQILSIPEYCQYDVDNGDNLCWATCSAMWISYVLGDRINRTLQIADLAGCYSARKWYNALRGLGISKTYQEERHMSLNKEEIKSILDSGSPIAALYGGKNNRGHWVLISGYKIINGEMSIIYNDPAIGYPKQEKNYEDFQTYDDGRMWDYTALNESDWRKYVNR